MSIRKSLTQGAITKSFILFLLITIAMGLCTAATASTYVVSASTQSNRSGAVALNGSNLNGSVYIFTGMASQPSNFNATGISGVCFWLDNTAMSGGANHCEGMVPYDFAGTDDASGVANSWNANSVANGTHTITQKVTMTSGAIETDTATFTIGTVAPAGVFALSVSTQSSRNGAMGLNGATISGTDYIFTSPASQLTNYNPAGISGVCYWLDNTAMSSGANHCEGYMPYDFAGSNDAAGVANAWSTTGIANGTHTITQKVTLTSGATEVDTATFKISNGAPAPAPVAAPTISTSSLPGGTVSTAYSTTLAGNGGTTPYNWSLASGSLPSGVSLAGNGTISGTPSATGSFAITVRLTDAAGQSATHNETLTVSGSTPAPTGASKFFAPNSFINTPLPASPSIDPNSASMVANSLGAQASAAHLSNGGYAVGLVYTSASDKVYSVACTVYDSSTCLVGSHINFPIPKGAIVPSGTDHNTSFIYTANDGSPYAGMELDCWIAQYNSSNDTWSCGTASLVHNNTTTAWGTCAEGNITSFHCNGGYAAGFDFAAGPVRPEEIQAGKINHALVVALSNPGSGITCPATHTDHSGSGVPEGGHFFLPASYNVDAQSWPAWVKVIGHALQTYGGYIVDYGGSMEVKGFTDQNPGSISWASVGVPNDQGGDLNMIPWGQMQVVSMQSCN